MKILFLGNSFLVSYLEFYKSNMNNLDSNLSCSFCIDRGGWGPAFEIVNDFIQPSTRPNKDIYPDIFYPSNVLSIPITSYDAIVFVSLGFIDQPLNTDIGMYSYYQMYDYVPKANTLTNIPISKSAYTDVIINFIGGQYGIKLFESLKKYNIPKYVVEQPFFTEKIFTAPPSSTPNDASC
jgi:hypothetical protein